MEAAASKRGEMDTSARVKALYYIMQSMEVNSPKELRISSSLQIAVLEEINVGLNIA